MKKSLMVILAAIATSATLPFSAWGADPVAKIGDNNYFTLADAVAAVPTDGTETTITMIADYSFSDNAGVEIAKTQNVVLDLNGHVVSHTAPVAGESCCIYNDGKLTIQDSSDTNADGTGTGKLTTFAPTVDTGDKPSYANNLILNSGEVTVMSGLLENTSAAGATYVIDLDWPEEPDGHVKVNIDGGCLSAPYSTGVRIYAFVMGDNDYTLNMTGGKIEAHGYGIHTKSSDSGVKVTINISGGTVSSTSYMAICDDNEKYEEPTACDNMTYNITGGTFSSASDEDEYRFSLYTLGAALNISGGVFENNVGAYTKKIDITDGEFNEWVDFHCYVSGATLDWSVSGGRFAKVYSDEGLHPTGFITGGVFTWPPYDDMIAEGYITVDNTDAETMAAYPFTVQRSAPPVTFAVRSDNLFGSIKIEGNVASNLYVSVPFEGFEADGALRKAQDVVHATNLTAGTKMYVYDKTADRYDVFEVDANGKWAAADKLTVDVEGKATFDTADLTRGVTNGTGVIVGRKNTAETVYVYGQVPKIPIASTTFGAGQTLVSPPYTNGVEYVDLNASTWTGVKATGKKRLKDLAGADYIQFRTADNRLVKYYYLEGEGWGVVPTQVSQFSDFVANGKALIPVGTAFWYYSNKGGAKVEWK